MGMALAAPPPTPAAGISWPGPGGGSWVARPGIESSYRGTVVDGRRRYRKPTFGGRPGVGALCTGTAAMAAACAAAFPTRALGCLVSKSGTRMLVMLGGGV